MEKLESDLIWVIWFGSKRESVELNFLIQTEKNGGVNLDLISILTGSKNVKGIFKACEDVGS